LETRAATGGCGFVQFGGENDVDNEMYVDVRLGSRQLGRAAEHPLLPHIIGISRTRYALATPRSLDWEA
jgi:hypothetical protein